MDDRFLEDLKNRIDIVDLVRKYAELKKSGKNYMCRSPFRNERTPSFCVSPDKQFWYDFGTSEGGDAISFIEKIENLNFQESVEMLADMAGIDVPKIKNKKSVSKETKKDIYDLHEYACKYFEAQLQKHADAQAYLKSRKISPQTIHEWRLGYGGDTHDGLTKHLLSSGFSQEQIAQSGVAFEREFGNKTMKDRFAGRIMIPIQEPRDGKIIAFSGRDIRNEKKIAKYINSPENPVYHKSSTLFGLFRARKEIRTKDHALLVEGNFDVISVHGAGFPQTIATCGTALTEDHLRILKRQTKNIYLAFDSDRAGKKATLKGVELCLQQELTPYIIDIEGGKDLDDLAQKDPQILKKTIKNAQNALHFLLDRFAKKFLDGSIEGEKKFLDALFYFVNLLHRPIEIDDMLTRIATKINRPKEIVLEEFKKFHQQKTKYIKPKIDHTQPKKWTREENFVGFISAHWSFFGQYTDRIQKQALPVFTEKKPQEILTQIIQKIPLSSEEQKTLHAWELHQELLYDENTDQERLKKDFKEFIERLQKELTKKEKIKEAQALREKI